MKAIRQDNRKAYDKGYKDGLLHAVGYVDQINTILLNDELGLSAEQIQHFSERFMFYCGQVIDGEIDFKEVLEVTDEIRKG